MAQRSGSGQVSFAADDLDQAPSRLSRETVVMSFVDAKGWEYDLRLGDLVDYIALDLVSRMEHHIVTRDPPASKPSGD